MARIRRRDMWADDGCFDCVGLIGRGSDSSAVEYLLEGKVYAVIGSLNDISMDNPWWATDDVHGTKRKVATFIKAL
eukprot:2894390-Pyramimonas_sp.AAC.1